MHAYLRVGTYYFPNIFSKRGHFLRITKQGITSLFHFNKTKQSAKSNRNNIKVHTTISRTKLMLLLLYTGLKYRNVFC